VPALSGSCIIGPVEGTPEELSDLQSQVDDLALQTTDNRIDIDALVNRANKSDVRADAMDLRAEQIEDRARIDRDMITDLQAEGILSREHTAQMEQALKSSRTIGAAIGILMASRGITEDQAFAVLKQSSQSANRKLREIAAELVRSVRTE
jgi:hypothetical protein